MILKSLNRTSHRHYDREVLFYSASSEWHLQALAPCYQRKSTNICIVFKLPINCGCCFLLCFQYLGIGNNGVLICFAGIAFQPILKLNIKAEAFADGLFEEGAVLF